MFQIFKTRLVETHLNLILKYMKTIIAFLFAIHRNLQHVIAKCVSQRL